MSKFPIDLTAANHFTQGQRPQKNGFSQISLKRFTKYLKLKCLYERIAFTKCTDQVIF